MLLKLHLYQTSFTQLKAVCVCACVCDYQIESEQVCLKGRQREKKGREQEESADKRATNESNGETDTVDMRLEIEPPSHTNGREEQTNATDTAPPRSEGGQERQKRDCVLTELGRGESVI